MGDPRKARKKYQTPMHPWQAGRIAEEIKLQSEFGLANKREIWKADSILRVWRNRAKKALRLVGERRKRAEDELFRRIIQLDLLKENAKLDDVLAITLPALLDRRLQTQVHKQGMANTVRQARQFIAHKKVFVDGKLISAPSYLVRKADKITLSASIASLLKVSKAKPVVAPKVEAAEQ